MTDEERQANPILTQSDLRNIEEFSRQAVERQAQEEQEAIELRRVEKAVNKKLRKKARKSGRCVECESLSRDVAKLHTRVEALESQQTSHLMNRPYSSDTGKIYPPLIPPTLDPPKPDFGSPWEAK